ncbi:hypothetical protein FFM54_28195 [Burkholderia pseudomallei]|nr:hypothetical protein FFM54_28195 [Burkholderia pseudomallei]
MSERPRPADAKRRPRLEGAAGCARGRTSGRRAIRLRPNGSRSPARPNPERSGPTGEGARESRRRQQTWRQR